MSNTIKLNNTIIHAETSPEPPNLLFDPPVERPILKDHTLTKLRHRERLEESPRPLDKKTKDAFVQGYFQYEVKIHKISKKMNCSQLCVLFHSRIHLLLAGMGEYFTSD